MPLQQLDRRDLLLGLLAIGLTTPALAQHSTSDGTTHGTGGGRGGQGGGQHGRPADRHADDDHGDDHGDDHDDDGHTSDDHGDDHASGSQGGGKGPYYRGGRDAVSSATGHGRSLEDKVLKRPSFQ
jgi:hypothetical protein